MNFLFALPIESSSVKLGYDENKLQ